jgi:ribosomal protein S18 acetylase RimI-like enzyme
MVTIAQCTAAGLRERVREAMTVYETAMAYPPGTGAQRAGYAVGHTRLAGFRAVLAVEDAGDRLVGFGYGYTSRAGQWWHDQVRLAIGPELAGRWLVAAFELCELHVLPEYQGRAIGREILLALSELVTQRRMLLSTPEGPTRAWRLYTSLGFVPLARQYRFPGDVRPFGILGAHLPLTAQPAAQQG